MVLREVVASRQSAPLRHMHVNGTFLFSLHPVCVCFWRVAQVCQSRLAFALSRWGKLSTTQKTMEYFHVPKIYNVHGDDDDVVDTSDSALCDVIDV